MEETKAKMSLQEDFWRNTILRESLLKQESRIKWLKESDCNSKFFHMAVNWQRRKNMTRGINVDGSWNKDPFVVKEEAQIFYKIRFSEDFWERPCLEEVHFESISLDDNAMLIEGFGEEEVKEAILECGNSKSRGSNGYNFILLKECWSFLKKDIHEFLGDFHASENFPRGANASFVALIPKIEEPQGWGARGGGDIG